MIRIPAPKWGEVGCPVVVPKPQTQLSEEDYVPWMRDRMAHYKVPKSVILLDELPKTGANFVYKKLLRDQYGDANDDL